MATFFSHPELLPLPAPRRVVRAALDELGLGIGSRVGIASNLCDAWGGFLGSLGIACESVDDRPTESILPFNPERDATFVHESSHFRGDLFTQDACERIADYLSATRPGGALVIVSRIDRSNLTAGHEPQCWAKCVSVLSGRVWFREFKQSYFSPQSWVSLLSGTPRERYHIHALRLPSERRSREAWLSETATLSEAATACCRQVETPRSSQASRRSA